MGRVLSFVKLDFVTVKPYLSIKNLLIYAAVTIFQAVQLGSVSTGIMVGLVLGTLFIGYPFSLGEKCNMDTLYTTLSVSRKNVVAGRYIFSFVLDLCCVLATFVLSTFSVFASRLLGSREMPSDTPAATLVLCAIFLVVQVIQLPLFFKFGYSKAKFFTLVPFAALSAAYLGIINTMNHNDSISGYVSTLTIYIEKNRIFTVTLSVAAICLILYGSYQVSLKFYRKREF
jgi:hypothetical protein